jgi:hypothetical protein
MLAFGMPSYRARSKELSMPIFARRVWIRASIPSVLGLVFAACWLDREPVTLAPPSGDSSALAAEPASTASPPKAPAAGGVIRTPRGDVTIFPADNPWNQDISKLPKHPRSDDYLNSVGLEKRLHPDFGTVWNGAPSGIPYNLVAGDQAKQTVPFVYPDESDHDPYPIPAEPLLEGGPNAPVDSDRHILMIDYDAQKLYELYHCLPLGDGRWKADSGAIFDLNSNKLRPLGWTSADAAGLPIFPGLVRYEEVIERKAIRHALRFTVRKTQRAYVLPATHFASRSTDPTHPPMGLRVRLKADYNISKFSPACQVILQALKTYGMLLADNGGDWFVSGCPDPRWNDEELQTLKRVKVSDFEAVDTGPLITR